MPNYNNGKIYSIRSYQTDDIYIGSTTQDLCVRMADHRKKYKSFLQGKYNYVSSFDIIKRGDAYIELIQEIPCNNILELRKYEGNYIRNMDCINKIIPGRTKKQWEKDNFERRQKYKKDRYYKNKYKISEKNKIKYNCICGGKYTYGKRLRHNKTIKHRQYIFNLHNELNHL